jgi:hypothetical protein
VGGNPITKTDPAGTCPWCIVIVVGVVLFGGLGAAQGATSYLITTPRDNWRLDDARDAALNGATKALSVATWVMPGPNIARLAGPFVRFLPRSGILFRTATGQAIVGYTRHALNQAISRQGTGVAIRAIYDTLKNPVSVVKQADGVTVYVGATAKVVVSARGVVITVIARTRRAWRIQ